MRSLAALPCLAALWLSVSVDPDPRGPLAAVADLWLAGHDDLARAYLAEQEAHLARHGLRAADLGLKTPPAAPQHALLDVYLARELRDDGARALFRAIALCARGERAAARAEAARLCRLRDTPRARVLLRSLGGTVQALEDP